VSGPSYKLGSIWRITWRVGVLLLIAASLCGSLLMARAVVKRRLEARIAAQIAAIRRLGEPVTAQDFDKLYPRLPDASNSALVYLRASSNFGDFDWPDGDETNSPFLWVVTNTSPSAPIPPETKLTLRGWLETNRVTLELMHQGARIKEGICPLDLSRGFVYARGARLSGGGEAARLLIWEAILAADDGHSDLAFHTLMDSFGFARSLKDHPFPIAQLLRESCLSISAFGLERILSRTHLTGEQLAELQVSFHQAQEVDWIKGSMMEGRASVLEVCGLLPKPPAWYLLFKRGEDRNYAWWWFLLYPQRNTVDYLDFMERYVTTASLPLSQRLGAEYRIAREVQSNRSSFGKWFPPPANWAGYSSGYAISQAKMLTAETALAIERYRLANEEKIPGELKDLVPAFLAALPAGPVDTKSLQFTKQGNGYVISTTVLNVDYDGRNGMTLEDVTFTMSPPDLK
jgi:hypothetical protein